jgi:hypothetical protein
MRVIAPAILWANYALIHEEKMGELIKRHARSTLFFEQATVAYKKNVLG